MGTFCARCAALAIAATLCAGSAAVAARQPVHSLNPANDKLLKLRAPERAAMLARAVGHWCIGTEAFLMGVIAGGPGEGNAYWSLRCADGSEWAVQIDSQGQYVAIGCDEYKAAGAGKECFQKF